MSMFGKLLLFCSSVHYVRLQFFFSHIKPNCRLDSLVGLFAAGCQPSSTNDPFGLRRIAYGLVCLVIWNALVTFGNSSIIFYLSAVGATSGWDPQKCGFKTSFATCCCCSAHKSRCQDNWWCKNFALYLSMEFSDSEREYLSSNSTYCGHMLSKHDILYIPIPNPWLHSFNLEKYKFIPMCLILQQNMSCWDLLNGLNNLFDYFQLFPSLLCPCFVLMYVLSFNYALLSHPF